LTFLSTVRAADQDAARAPNDLADAEPAQQAAALDNVMAATFELHGSLSRKARLERDLVAPLDAPARSIERSLRILIVVEAPQQHLQVALRLHRTSDDAEGHAIISGLVERERPGMIV
jgi:hypothetical protein